MADTNVTGGARRELTKYRVTFAAAVIGLAVAGWMFQAADEGWSCSNRQVGIVILRRASSADSVFSLQPLHPAGLQPLSSGPE